MRKFIFIILLLLMAVPLLGINNTIKKRPNSYWWHTGKDYRTDPARMWAYEVEDFIEGNMGTGNVWYVDSGATGQADGTSMTDACVTLDACVSLSGVTANNGDRIYVAQNHAENLTATTTIDVDVAGLTILGLGEGTDAPTFTYTQSAGAFSVGAANVWIDNLRFELGTDTVTMGISVESTADNFRMTNCFFPEPATTAYDFVDAINLAAGADYVSIIGNTFLSASNTGCAHFVEAGNGVNMYLTITDNEVHGEFSVSAIWSDTIDVFCNISRNKITQLTSGQHCIEFTAAATGMCIDNRLYAASNTCLDAGSMSCYGNTVVTAVETEAQPIPFVYGREYYTSKVATGNTDDLWDVSGGPIIITGMYGVVTTVMGATATAIELQIDADAGSAYDLDFTTLATITSDAEGAFYCFDTAIGEASMTTDIGYSVSMIEWYCPEGMIEQWVTNEKGDNTGAVTWYMTYMPTASNTTVTAQ